MTPPARSVDHCPALSTKPTTVNLIFAVYPPGAGGLLCVIRNQLPARSAVATFAVGAAAVISADVLRPLGGAPSAPLRSVWLDGAIAVAQTMSVVGGASPSDSGCPRPVSLTWRAVIAANAAAQP